MIPFNFYSDVDEPDGFGMARRRVLWGLVYTGRPLGIIGRIKVWIWLRQCERFIRKAC